MSERKEAGIQQMDTYTLESMLANVQNLEEYEAIMQQAQSQNGIWKQQITAVMVEPDQRPLCEACCGRVQRQPRHGVLPCLQGAGEAGERAGHRRSDRTHDRPDE